MTFAENLNFDYIFCTIDPLVLDDLSVIAKTMSRCAQQKALRVESTPRKAIDKT